MGFALLQRLNELCEIHRIEEDENIADRIRDGVILLDLEQSIRAAYKRS